MWEQLNGSNFGRELNKNKKAITTSWNDSASISLSKGYPLFEITIEALEDIKLSDVIAINSRVVWAEAYDQNDDLLKVVLRFDNQNPLDLFRLYQNQPNPFASFTTIAFELPESNDAVLTIHDITGKTIYQKRGKYDRGYNEIKISRNELPVSGMMYNTLASGSNTATLRMMLID